MEIRIENLKKCVFDYQFCSNEEVSGYLEEKYYRKRESKELIEVIDGEEYYYCGKGRWYYGIVYWKFRRLKDDKLIEIKKWGK